MARRESVTRWLTYHWHVLAVVVYLGICLMDFVIMPIVVQIENQRFSTVETVMLATRFTDPSAQLGALHELHQQHVWEPLTLQGGGLFHVAFGAILSVAGYRRDSAFASAPPAVPVAIMSPPPPPPPAPMGLPPMPSMPGTGAPCQ